MLLPNDWLLKHVLHTDHWKPPSQHGHACPSCIEGVLVLPADHEIPPASRARNMGTCDGTIGHDGTMHEARAYQLAHQKGEVWQLPSHHGDHDTSSAREALRSEATLLETLRAGHAGHADHASKTRAIPVQLDSTDVLAGQYIQISQRSESGQGLPVLTLQQQGRG